MINVLTPSSTQCAFEMTFSDLDSRVFPVSSTTHIVAVPVVNIVYLFLLVWTRIL